MANIRLSIVVDAPAEQIFPLVATAHGFTRWWALDVTEKDGNVDLGFFKRATVYRLKLAKVQSPVQAEWRCVSGQEWNGTRVVFELVGEGGKSQVRFTHADWKDETDYFVLCTTTWGELMYRLKATAEGKGPGPLFSADGMAY